MNADDHRDRLIDMLLRELVGGETPPDVRERVLTATGVRPLRQSATIPAPRRRPRPLQKRAPRSPIPLLAAAAVISLLAVAASFHFRGVVNSRTPLLTLIVDSVEQEAVPLRPGKRLTTDTRSTARLAYPDGTILELAADGLLETPVGPWWKGAKELDLLAGTLTADVRPQPAGAPLVIHAGATRAEVLGTRFSLRHDEVHTRLEVVEGEVRFSPQPGVAVLAVTAGSFAEKAPSGVTSGSVVPPQPKRGILRFTWMNADTDGPLRDEPLRDGESLSLAALPTRNMNLRADYEGECPASVKTTLIREDGGPTGVPSAASNHQTEPPFFAAGDHWSDGRPDDCRSWTPAPGRYKIAATATYADGENTPPLERVFVIVE